MAPLLHRDRAGVGALLVLLARAAAAAYPPDDLAAEDDGRSAERRQDLALEHRRHDGPEAALRHHLRQLLVRSLEGGGRHRLGARRLRREEARAVAAGAQDQPPRFVDDRYGHRRAERLGFFLRRAKSGL